MRHLLFLFACLSALSLSAQTKTTLKGAVQDTTGATISYATVMLLNPADSALINFTRTDEKGLFTFKNIKNSNYVLKISYIGYIPFQLAINPVSSDINDLGILKIKPINQQLMEVVIRTAKAPLYIRGDTIEYDASMFKVPPGSTVEDLLRRLPGIELDADGNIKAQGKDVKRVYVDGKTFFGDDPKAATKNLGAETISRVQVYDEKSEQAKITGIDDGKKEKALNLELKEEFKKGSFGKITAGAGTEGRWVGRGNFNKFNTKEQLSFIGYGNNINQTGVNWEDYGEFKGQNSFNNDDNGDFGFSSGRNFYYSTGDDAPMNRFDGRGFTRNFGGGTNYNYDHKKNKLNLSYFYNETALTLDQYSLRATFLDERSLTNTDTTVQSDYIGNHSIGGRWEIKMDSSNTLIVKANTRINHNVGRMQQNQRFFEDPENPTNELEIDNDKALANWRLNSSAIFRHRFKKKGRTFALSAGYNGTESDGKENLFSLNRFFEAENFTEQARLFNQNESNTNQYKSSALFSDALGKKWFGEIFYNFSHTDNQVNRQVQAPDAGFTRVDSLSVFFDNNIRYQRAGAALRYSYEGLNVAFGGAGQQIEIGGVYSRDRGTPNLANPLSRTFRNFTPNLDVSYEFPGNKWLNLSYSYNITPPQFSDLQPVPNVNNPAFRSEGNPNLEPERRHNAGLNFNTWNPANFSYYGIGADLGLYDNRIVYNQTVEIVDSVGFVSVSKPQNVDNGKDANVYFWSGFPIIKTKLTMNIDGGFNYDESPSFVNNLENTTISRGVNLDAGFSFTPNAKLVIGIEGSGNLQTITYSIQSDQNQEIERYSGSGSVKWQFASKTFFESNFNYSKYRNERFSFDQEVSIWNASVRRIFGPSNKLELRLAAFDLLNRRISIVQQGTQNYVFRSISPTLSRYFMLSLSYNMRGYEDKMTKNNWW